LNFLYGFHLLSRGIIYSFFQRHREIQFLYGFISLRRNDLFHSFKAIEKFDFPQTGVYKNPTDENPE
jgi:hypothetical protein